MKRRAGNIGSGAVLVSVLSLLAAGCGGSPGSHAGGGLTATTTAALGHPLPVSVQSDSAMIAAGNEGPSSTILVPSSCTVTATSATATGTYQGGFVPMIYQQYGDVVDLYVFTGPVQGDPQGIQVANEPFTRHAPFIAGLRVGVRWTVTVPLDSLGKPARCMVAAQPTMDFQGPPA
jgi:hypothetical protein